MPTNVTYEYIEAEKKFHGAKTTKEKIKALQEMLRTCPTHKGCEKLRSQLKRKVSKLKQGTKSQRKSKKGDLNIKKEGAAQIVLIGLPNSGKSTLLQKLSGKPVEIADYEFTTKKPVIRMIPFENIKIQAIEIPAFYRGFVDNPKSGQYFGVIRNADLVIIVNEFQSDIEIVNKELEEANITSPFLAVNQTEFNNPNLKEKIWSKLKVIRVQTKSKGRTAAKPVILKINSTVNYLARTVHKDFLKNFKHAKIWGPSSKFPGQQVGLKHVLKDKDIVEIFTR